MDNEKILKEGINMAIAKVMEYHDESLGRWIYRCDKAEETVKEQNKIIASLQVENNLLKNHLEKIQTRSINIVTNTDNSLIAFQGGTSNNIYLRNKENGTDKTT